MSLVVRRQSNETWRECVRRIADAQGLAMECLEAFDHDVAQGASDQSAAFDALYDWDCCDIEPD